MYRLCISDAGISTFSLFALGRSAIASSVFFISANCLNMDTIAVTLRYFEKRSFTRGVTPSGPISIAVSTLPNDDAHASNDFTPDASSAYGPTNLSMLYISATEFVIGVAVARTTTPFLLRRYSVFMCKSSARADAAP